MFRSFVIAVVSWMSIAAVAGAQDLKTKGAQVFSDQKCGVCHSIAGKGNPKGALDEVASKISSDEIRMWIVDPKAMTAKTKAERKPAMRTYNLPKEDVDALVAYLDTMKKK